MFGKSIFSSLKHSAAEFVGANRGNVAAIFAIALVPMLGIVGAAIDYSRAAAARSAMQAALDTTALMVSKDAAANPTLTAAQATASAQKYFKALYQNGDASGVVINATFTANTGAGSSVQVTGSASVATDFMKMAGFTSLDIGTSSTTKWGNTRMRVAMVLDNTGSMSDNGKMPAMQKAANNMVDSLSAFSKETGDVYISLVPFAKNVNLGSGFDQRYIKWSSPTGSNPTSNPSTTLNPDTWDENNGTCSVGSSSTKTSCLAQSSCSLPSYTTKNTCTAAGVCSNAQYTTQSTCTAATGSCSNAQYTTQNTCTSNKGTWTTGKYTWTAGNWGTGYASWTPNNHSTWTGCIMDRDQDYDIKNTAPVLGDTSTVSTLFPAQEYTQGSTNYCKTGSKAYLQPIMPMTNNWTALKTAITNMNPTGGTNQAIGVVWGWQSLSTTNGPIAAPAKDPNFVYQDYLVILSDGLNTQNRWTSYGNGNTQNTCSPGNVPCIDARQQTLCDSIKKDNIKIFTIQVNINSIDPQSKVLQACASDNNFQMITAASQTAGAFANILAQIAKLRISQ